MLEVEVTEPSPAPTFPPTLADLSRNASVISTSSSDSGPPSPVLRTPKARPYRTFTSPRSRSPRSHSRGSRPPPHLSKEFGLEEDSEEVQAATEAARARSASQSPGSALTSARDFSYGATLGEGSYSEVKRVTYLPTGQVYAMKILEKNFLKRKDKMQTAMDEKNALVRLSSGHPGIVRLHHAFHDQWRLYFVLDFVPNGEMQSLLSRLGSLSVKCSQYYGAQIVDALTFMHGKGVVHRDLKPENLLLDESYRIKICDFGTAKILVPGAEPERSFVGTAQYVSPEMITKNETSISIDYWAFGCIIFQMISGHFTFHGLSAYLTMEKIKKLEYTFPDGFDEQAKDLVQKVLVREPTERLGVGAPGTRNDSLALRNHAFFGMVNWDTIWLDPTPPLEPGLFKKEPAPAIGHGPNWDDEIHAWEELVASEGPNRDDEIPWASDAQRPEYMMQPSPLSNGYHAMEVGPMGELPSYARPPNEGSEQEQNLPSSILFPGIAEAGRNDPPFASSSSSSEDSPAEQLGEALDSLNISPGEGSSGRLPQIQNEPERGRSPTPIPLQCNDPLSEMEILPFLQQTETIVYQSMVEFRPLRRRASKLLSLSVSSVKPKTRYLLLTSRRLLCIKRRQRKAIPPLSIKTELNLRSSAKFKDKDKESRTVVMAVERKGEREFVVLTSSKSYCYVPDNPDITAVWVDQINKALQPAFYGWQ